MGNFLSSVKKIRFSLLAVAIIAGIGSLSAQCGLSSFNAGATLTPTTTFQPTGVSAGSGTYIDFNVVAGNIYSFKYNSLTDPNNGSYFYDMTLSSTSSVLPYNNSLTPLPNSWTGGIGCPSSSRPASAEWYATYTGTMRVNVKEWNGTCHDWVSGGGSAVVNYKYCPSTADLGPGNGSWNVEAFATPDITIPQPNARYGTYNDVTSGLDFNTSNYWASNLTPGAASGWNGCTTMEPENFVVRARRTNFPCNLYQIQAVSGDDSVGIYLNGTQIFLHTAFSSPIAVGSYVLGATDVLEIREVATCGTNAVHVNLSQVGLPALNAGTIGGVTDNSSICQGTVIGNFTNTLSASGGTAGEPNGGAITYDWQLSTDGGSTFSSVGVNTAFWNSTTTVPPNAVYVIRRNAIDGCGTTVHSNTITVIGRATPNGSMSPSAVTICPNTSATLTLNLTPPASGPFNVTYTDGVNTYTANNVNDGSTITVTPLVTTTYSFTSITDQYGCNRTTGFTGGALVIIEPALQITNVTVSNVLCNGGNTGIIVVSANGGIGPLSYSDDNAGTFQSSNTFNGLTIGSNYNVVVKDSFGCSINYVNNPITITQPTPLIIDSLTEVDASCASVFNGQVKAYASGGTSPYSYSLNGGPIQPFSLFNGVAAGTYTVTVYDHNLCSVSSSITVNNTYVDSVVITSTTPSSCFGVHDGSFTAQVMGGVAPYQYSINGITYQPSGTFSGLAAGSYIVVGQDSRGCLSSANVTVGGPTSSISVAIDSITNVLCYGATTGGIYITVSGGSPGYTFNWSNGVHTEDNVGITGGTYNVTVTDSHNCPPVVANATVQTPYALSLNIASYSNPLCHNDSTGSVYLDEAGGVPPYSFAWNNGITSQDITHLAAGSYTVTVTDNNGCTSNISQALTNPTAIIVTTVGTNVSCSGTNTGSATLTVSGGTPGYTFQWSDGQGDQNITGLGGGLYYVVVTDNNGCQQRDSVTINEPAPLVVTGSVVNVSCFGANDGTITQTVSGGAPGYTFAWSNGATTEDLTGLTGGQYCVTITDTHNCNITACYTVVNPSQIIAGLIVKNVLCFGDNNGGINLVVSGGTPGYNYAWSNGAVTQNLTNVPPGAYILTITDSRGCIQVDSTTISSPGPLFTSGIVKNVSCNNYCDGAIFTTPYGGTLPYTFFWSTGQTTANIVQLCGAPVDSGGIYYLTLTDANNCHVVSLYVVNNPAPLTVNTVSANSSCAGSCNGSVAAIPHGGTTPYSYLWNNFSLDSAQINICAGQYTILLTDSNGCRASSAVTVTDPTPINITGTVTNVLCHSFNTGAVSTTVSGGSGSYSYTWTGGSTSSGLSSAVAGTYGLTVTDGNGCTASASFTITEPGQIFTVASIDNPHCYGGNDGFISVAVSGGTQPYIYNWSTSPSQVGAVATNLSPGSYSLTVTDFNGCQASLTAFVNNTLQMTITATTNPAHCYNTATGSVIGTVVNGKPPYTWHVNGAAQDSNVFFNLLPGNYILEVVDANGCDATTSFVIAAPSPVTVSLSAPEDVILTGMSTQLVATAISTSPIINYFWSPDTITGAGVFDFSGCTDSTNCSSPYVKPPFTATFTVTVLNSDSCSASDTVTVYVNNEKSAFIPNAFTPNGDGKNDRFEFDILGATTVEVAIFDRWGERIYYNANQANGMDGTSGWDGTKSGKYAPSDTYVYQFNVTYFDGTKEKMTGTVTLMR